MSEPAPIYDRFRLQVLGLQEGAKNLSESVLLDAQRKWQTPEPGSWQGDPLDIPGITGAFDREDINANYETRIASLSARGVTADCVALKLQIDWLAMKERAFRTEHASSIRCDIHAAARRRGHGHDQGVLVTGILSYVQNLSRR